MSRWSAPGRATTATASRAGSGAERLLLRVGAASAAQRRRIPARARCEAVAVLRLQRLQALQHGVDASLADVLDRAAAERGEAGAEDHARIEQVGIFDHAVVQRGDGLVEQRQHQPVLEVPGHLVVLRHLGLLRLALGPGVPALAVLLAALARPGWGGQPGWDFAAAEGRQLLPDAGGDLPPARVAHFSRPPPP